MLAAFVQCACVAVFFCILLLCPFYIIHVGSHRFAFPCCVWCMMFSIIFCFIFMLRWCVHVPRRLARISFIIWFELSRAHRNAGTVYDFSFFTHTHAHTCALLRVRSPRCGRFCKANKKRSDERIAVKSNKIQWKRKTQLRRGWARGSAVSCMCVYDSVYVFALCCLKLVHLAGWW